MADLLGHLRCRPQFGRRHAAALTKPLQQLLLTRMEHHFLARSGNRELPVRSQRIAVSTALTLNGGLARTKSKRPVQNGGNLGDAFERFIWNVPALSRLTEKDDKKSDL